MNEVQKDRQSCGSFHNCSLWPGTRHGSLDTKWEAIPAKELKSASLGSPSADSITIRGQLLWLGPSRQVEYLVSRA